MVRNVAVRLRTGHLCENGEKKRRQREKQLPESSGVATLCAFLPCSALRSAPLRCVPLHSARKDGFVKPGQPGPQLQSLTLSGLSAARSASAR